MCVWVGEGQKQLSLPPEVVPFIIHKPREGRALSSHGWWCARTLPKRETKKKNNTPSSSCDRRDEERLFASRVESEE